MSRRASERPWPFQVTKLCSQRVQSSSQLWLNWGLRKKTRRWIAYFRRTKKFRQNLCVGSKFQLVLMECCFGNEFTMRAWITPNCQTEVIGTKISVFTENSIKELAPTHWNGSHIQPNKTNFVLQKGWSLSDWHEWGPWEISEWSTKTQENCMTSTQRRRNWSKQNMLELMNSLAFLKDQK